MPDLIRTAIFGTGFMGRVHLEALRRVEHVEIAAIVGRNTVAARQLGSAFNIPRLSPEAVLADRSIHAVHLCTPNALHFSQAKAALLAGKHVLCEKPLATTAQEAEELVALAATRELRNCVCHNLRCYPMVQQMRAMREAGSLGDILVVQGAYSQDWLLYDTDWNWRVDSRAGGPSRCMADIGSHWPSTSPACASPRSAPTSRPSTPPANSPAAPSKPSPTSSLPTPTLSTPPSIPRTWAPSSFAWAAPAAP